MNPLYEQMETSVFERMSGLAAKHGAVNLGQGFPDFGWPDEILEAAAQGGGRRFQPICAVARAAGAARGGRGPLRPPLRARSQRRPRVRDQRRDRGARRGDPGDDRARRRGDHLHPGLRQLCADDPAGGGDVRARSRCSRPGGASSATRSRRRSRRRPARSCSTIRTIRPGGCSTRMSWKRSPKSRATTT